MGCDSEKQETFLFNLVFCWVSCLLLVDAKVLVIALWNFPFPVFLADFKGNVTALPGTFCHPCVELTFLALKERN